jgi:superoxide dismutase, Cu-Zn family
MPDAVSRRSNSAMSINFSSFVSLCAPRGRALRPVAMTLLVVAASACARGRGAGPAPFAAATLRTPAGGTVGTATLRQVGGAVRLDVEVQGLPDGPHGLHLHTVGRCDAPDFATAGGHLNPGSMKHGTKNPSGPHAGDMPNVIVQGGKSSGYTAMTLRVTPGSEAGGVFDADGTA